MRVGFIKFFLLCSVLFTSVIGVTAMAEERDPWEKWNRKVFEFNDTLDAYALKPVAQAYRNVTPQVVDDAISNAFSNLKEPVVVTSDLAQGKWLQALSDTGRFLINSTVGILGLFDVARHIGLEKHDEDIGQALAYWGVESGPYVVLPILGPSTIRDTVGFGFETFGLAGIDPQVQAIDDVKTYYSSVYLEYLDIRADLIPVEGLISGDRYSFIRNLYLQRREFQINDGVVEDEFSDEFEEDFDDEDF